MLFRHHTVFLIVLGLSGCSFPSGTYQEADKPVYNSYTWINLDSPHGPLERHVPCDDAAAMVFDPLPAIPIIPENKLTDHVFIEERLVMHIRALREYIEHIQLECIEHNRVKKDTKSVSNSPN